MITCSGLMKIQNSSSYADRRVYRCQNNKCKKKVGIKNGSKFKFVNIEFEKLLGVILMSIFLYKLPRNRPVQDSEPS